MAKKKIRVPKRKYKSLKLNRTRKTKKKNLTAIGDFNFLKGIKRAALAAAALFIIYIGINFTKNINAYYNSFDNFGIKTITVRGAGLIDEETAQANVKNILKELYGTDSPIIFNVDINMVKKVLEGFYTEITGVEVYKKYPSSLRVEFFERVPIAVVKINNSVNYLMDKDFKIFKTERIKDYSFPIITGIKTVENEALTDAAQKEVLKEIFYFTPPAVLRTLDEINIADPSAVKVIAYNKEIRVGMGDLGERIKSGVDMARDYKDKKLEYIVVSGERRYIKW